MIRRLEKGTLYRRSTERNSYGEQVEEWVALSTPIELIISINGGTTDNTNDILSVSATHTGLTHDSRALTGDKIMCGGHTYRIDYIAAGARWIQLMLNEEKSL